MKVQYLKVFKEIEDNLNRLKYILILVYDNIINKFLLNRFELREVIIMFIYIIKIQFELFKECL